MFHMPNVLTFNGFVNSHILQVKWRGRLIACRRENGKKCGDDNGEGNMKENDRNNNVLFCKIVIGLCFSLGIPFYSSS